ncbi:conserved hypothetical protein [Thermosulfidibacter takaii ABI70S6]|uniref:Homocysteine biosynthesis enzyme sulfur-incorporation domain-containing protein n=1 Tax=Thermosulfidibacter takaii (strain DSM 17441 / JCM 13301 / NBRC 103674 / ABI70S6) TaxID=1298851 RepID=A0A0S3QU96_THET7|nr:homocysteine biosynthesis protein [Thermosulfidibacter takaii]BAT71891.1 conserved hypothetical protein [Thermosulfidibacter takaii ABI70S6]
MGHVVEKSIEEINEKIRQGKVVVVTAEEMIDIVEEYGPEEAARRVDVVTTGTFAPMCSSGAFLNVGHSKPRIKMCEAYLNGVPAYAGLAAVDLYIGATALPKDDPRNAVYPGQFRYGGGHVIEDLIAGRDVVLRAYGYGTDCYPRREVETIININTINEAFLFNPRNCYQNYNCAVNLSNRMIYTYMGVLKPNLGNATYCSAGQLSPLLNDPYYKTIGVGTRIFLGGGIGYVVSQGTQHTTDVPRGKKGVVKKPAGTLAVTGDMRGMNTRYVRGVSILGYGVSLAIGIGIPIPVLNEEIAWHTSVKDEEIWTQVVDYGHDYPYGESRVLGEVNYAQLRSGEIEINGKKVPTAPLSSYYMAREIAETLKKWIQEGSFELAKPVAPIPSEGCVCKPMKIRSIK